MFDPLLSFHIILTRSLIGTKQNGEELGDIKLPPWAKGDAIEFIRLHREVNVQQLLLR